MTKTLIHKIAASGQQHYHIRVGGDLIKSFAVVDGINTPQEAYGDAKEFFDSVKNEDMSQVLHEEEI